VSWGTQYRVFGELTLDQIQSWHRTSLHQLRLLHTSFPYLNDAFFQQYQAGSWEFAVASVFNDAHYQFGISLLTWAIEKTKKVDMKSLAAIIDRLATAASTLLTVQENVIKHGAFSSAISDLRKNTALSWLRLDALTKASLQFRDAMIKQDDEADEELLTPNLFHTVVHTNARPTIRRVAIDVIDKYVQAYPADKDVSTFLSALKVMKEEEAAYAAEVSAKAAAQAAIDAAASAADTVISQDEGAKGPGHDDRIAPSAPVPEGSKHDQTEL